MKKHAKTFSFLSLILLVGLIIIYRVVFFETVPVLATNNTSDMLIYRGGGSSQIPEFRTYNRPTFGSESTAINIGGAIQYIKILSKPNRLSAEKFACTLDGASDVNCQIYDGSTWGNLVEVSSAAGTQKAFDIAYENSSDDAMVCFRTNTVDTQTPGCRIWNGTSWGTEFSANSVGAAINTLSLVSSPGSDYIAMITRDATADINVQIWNGASWGNLQEVSTNGGSCAGCTQYDGSWEKSADDFIVTWFDDTNDAIYSREFDKSALWGSEITNVVTGLSTSDNIYVETDANPDPASNLILVGVLDDDNTLNFNSWNGSAWGTQAELSANINGSVAANNHLFSLAFEQTDDYDAIITYGSTANLLSYRVWDSNTSSWGSVQALPTAVEAKDWHQFASDPVGQNLMLTTVGTVNDVDTIEWTGSGWDSNWTSHETAGNNQFWNAWFTYDYEDEYHNPPDVSFNSGAQKTDGSGLVDISMEISDEGLHDTKARIEYETTGSECDGPWSNATLVGPATADFEDGGGAPDINNGQTYQVGSGTNTRIVTDSGANTIQFDWDTQTDLPTANATYCLRLTGNDDAADSETPATQALTVDNIAPTGLTELINVATSSTVQHLTWTPVTETNFNHYEIWYGANQADVQNRTGTASEWDEDNFLAMATRTTFHTHITNLTPATAYYFKIWAVDNFGNEETISAVSSTTDVAGNSVPTATAPTSISQASDGTGYVTFTTTIEDLDLEETLMRVRFSTDGGTTFYNAEIISVTPDYGTVSIDVDDFQIGKTNHIDTVAAGPHTVELIVVWDTKSADNQNGGLDNQTVNAILQVTPRDSNGEIGSDYNSVSFPVNNAGPTLTEVTPVPTGTTDTTPDYTFSSTAAGDISYAGACSSGTLLAISGTNTITLNTLAEGTYDNCSITVTDSLSNPSPALSISTFTVDITPPSGLNALIAENATTQTQELSWTQVTETNFNHYEIWYGTNQADVINRAGSATEWDNGDDANLSTKTTSSTTITGLSQNTLYYYKIWAVDIAANEETIADINATTELNVAPTGTFNSAAQLTDGSLDVHISIEAGDSNQDKLKAKIEYETDLGGSCDGPWADANMSGPVTADVNDSGGAPNVDNGSAYQIGSQNGTQIVTSSGNNTVTFEWDAETDLPSANGETACIRLTLNDGVNSQTTPATTTLVLDNTVPQVNAANITSAITTDNQVANVASIGDVIHSTWNNSASGDDNSDLASAYINLEAFGGNTSQIMYDNGTNGDETADDNIYSFDYTIVSGSVDSSNSHAHVSAIDIRGNETVTPDDNNVSVDSETPSSPGSLTASQTNRSEIILAFGSRTTADDFETYKIYYRSGSRNVTINDFQISNSNLNSINYGGVSEITFTDVAQGRDYFFNIWVYDDAGNSNSATETSITAIADSGIVLLGSQSSAGTAKQKTSKSTPETSTPETSTTKILDSACSRTTDTPVPFQDIKNHWAEQYIKDLYLACIIDGKSENTFGVNDETSRAETLKIAIAAFKISEVDFEEIFEDVKETDWFAKTVTTAYKTELAQGYENPGGDKPLFKPNNKVTRAEALKILMAAGGKVQETAQPSTFKDISPSDWFINVVMWAVENNIVEGYKSRNGTQTFKPNQPITRGEISKITVLLKNLR